VIVLRKPIVKANLNPACFPHGSDRAA